MPYRLLCLPLCSCTWRPVATILDKQGESGQFSKGLSNDATYQSVRHKLGLDLPSFYFSMGPSASCDTLYKITKPEVRDNFEHLTFIYGNWSSVAAYYSALNKFRDALDATKPDSSDADRLIVAKGYTSQFILPISRKI